MPKRPEQETSGAWKTGGLLALVLAAAGVATWAGLRAGGEERAKAEAICLGCNQASAVEVTATPGQEPWPRECPRCHARRLYLSLPCPRCSKPVPFKDPAGESFGQPKVCPHCQRDVEGP